MPPLDLLLCMLKNKQKAFINVWSRNFTPCTSLFLYSKLILLCLEVINENLQALAGFIFHKHFTRGENGKFCSTASSFTVKFNLYSRCSPKTEESSHFVWFIIPSIDMAGEMFILSILRRENLTISQVHTQTTSSRLTVHHLEYMQSTR